MAIQDLGTPAFMMTPSGTAFAMLPARTSTPAPLLLLFAMSAEATLTTEPYCRVGHLLNTCGWNVVSLDLPCHGANARAGEPPELAGWAARTAAGDDIIAPFRARVNYVIHHLVESGIADPARLAAAGTSRGGFMAFHAAAGNPLIRAVAAFAPVTDVLALSEFAGQTSNPLARQMALRNAVDTLAGRADWITIGNADARVGTENAVAFAQALAATHPPCDITLRVLPVPGHTSEAHWHDDAADWLLQKITP
jgi:dienelactone hydrolase